MKHDCHDYVGKISDQSENVYKSYDIFVTNIIRLYIYKRFLQARKYFHELQ